MISAHLFNIICKYIPEIIARSLLITVRWILHFPRRLGPRPCFSVFTLYLLRSQFIIELACHYMQARPVHPLMNAHVFDKKTTLDVSLDSLCFQSRRLTSVVTWIWIAKLSVGGCMPQGRTVSIELQNGCRQKIKWYRKTYSISLYFRTQQYLQTSR